MLLRHLDVQGVILLGSLRLNWTPGLNVITGETGSGKSIVVDTLRFIAGGRGDVSRIAPDADRLSVTAVFDLPQGRAGNAVRSVLQSMELEIGEELLLRRILRRDGRTRSFVDDTAVGLPLLRQLGRLLFDIQGQHDSLRDSSSAELATMLTISAGEEELAKRCSEAFHGWRDAVSHVQRFREQQQASLQKHQHQQEQLAFARRFDPKEGEVQELQRSRERARLTQARDALVHGIQQLITVQAQEAMIRALRLIEREPNAELLLPSALRDDLENALEGVRRIDQQVQQIRNEEGREDLDAIESRLYDLETLARQMGVTLGELSLAYQQLIESQEGVGKADADLAEARQKETFRRWKYLRQAVKLSRRRREAALLLAAKVMNELAMLKMEDVSLAIDVNRMPTLDHWTAGGVDRVSIGISTVPGTPLSALGKVASGGEMMRVLLAFKVAMKKALATIQIFDEIDRGIGGATAAVLGERMQTLAGGRQIIAVTHAPQVAARASAHVVVRRVSAESAQALILVSEDQIIDELARMIATEDVTPEAVAHARRLWLDGREEA